MTAMLPAGSWGVTIDSADDLVCKGGAGFSTFGPSLVCTCGVCVRARSATLKDVAYGRERPTGGEPNIRSGSPNTQGECRLKYPASGPVKSVQLEYRYAAGYGCGAPPDHTCENPPTMELWAQTDAGVNAGGPIYTNPKMDIKSG